MARTVKGYVSESHRRREAYYRRLRRVEAEAVENWPPRKEEAECCAALVDELGRPWPGFCSPECIRRPANWRLVVRGQPIPKGGALQWAPPGTQSNQRRESA